MVKRIVTVFLTVHCISKIVKNIIKVTHIITLETSKSTYISLVDKDTINTVRHFTCFQRPEVEDCHIGHNSVWCQPAQSGSGQDCLASLSY